jgi:eukaryotic-like serine/threonine-protein kinase
MQRRTWGPSHVAVAGSMASLAKLLTADGYSAEAEQLARDAIAIVAASLGTHHSDYAGSLGNLADVIALRGALDSAETLRRRALAIRVASAGPEHTITALTAVELADVLTRQRRFAEADSTYRSSLALLRRYTTESHVDVRRTYRSLAVLYDAWGKPDSAAVFRRLAQPAQSPAR